MEPWEKNHRIQIRAERQITKGFEAAEQDILDLLLDYIYQFRISNGKFDPEQNAASLINGIRGELFNVISDVNIDDQVTNFLDNFDEIEENIVTLHKQQNGINVSQRLLNSQKAFAIDATTFSMKEANVSLKFVEPIKKLLYNRVQFGASLRDTEQTLRKIVTGSAEEYGILRKWIGQVARDSISQYEGTLNQEIKSKYELTATRYVGSLVEDSRRQCAEWVAMSRIPDDVLIEQITWALSYGKGMIPGTVLENFCVNRGGYNCRHSAFPVK